MAKQSYHGRHRHGLPGLVHCRMLMQMAAALAARRTGWRPASHDVDSVRGRLAREAREAREFGMATAPVVPLPPPVRSDSAGARLAA